MTAFARTVLRRTARSVEAWAAAGMGVSLHPILLGLCLAASVFAGARTGRMIWTNGLELNDQLEGLSTVVASVVCVAFSMRVGHRLWARRRGIAYAAFSRSVFRALAWTFSLPLALLLRVPSEVRHPRFTLACIALAGASFAYSAYHWQWPKAWRLSERRRIQLAALAVGGLGLCFAYVVPALQNVNHHALNTGASDLGIYDNILYKTAFGDPLGSSISRKWTHYARGHFDPILLAIAPLYRLYPRAEFLHAFQAIWLGSSVIPLFLLARRFGANPFLTFSLCFGFLAYPALHGVALYDFHSLSLIIPLLPWAWWALEEERALAYATSVALLLSCREDVSFLVATLGAYGIFRGWRGRPWVGIATCVASLAYFAMVKTLFMMEPDVLSKGGGHANYFSELIRGRGGFRSMAATVLENPGYVLKNVLTAPKMLYAAQLLVPLACFPIVAPRGKVLLSFGVVFVFFSSRKWVHDIHFHYSAWFIPVLFALGALGVGRIQLWGEKLGLDGTRFTFAAATALLVLALGCTLKFGGIYPNDRFHAGFRPMKRELTQRQRRNYAWLRDVVERMEPGAKVAATDRFLPHVTNRHYAYRFAAARARRSDYVVVDERYISQPKNKRRYRAWKASHQLIEVEREGRSFVLYRTAWRYSPEERAKWREVEKRLTARRWF